MSSGMLKDWSPIYEKYGHMDVAPQKEMPEAVELFKEKGVRKVLDLGCGSGRHLVYLAEQGFEVFGIDLAKKAIELAENWLHEKGLTAKLEVKSMFERLPYEDDFFDAIISIRVINHGRIEGIRNTIREMQRVLKPKGLIFIAVRRDRKARESKRQRARSEIIDPRTIIPLKGIQKGVIHYLFNKSVLLKEFKNFEILNFRVDPEGYYCLLGELRH